MDGVVGADASRPAGVTQELPKGVEGGDFSHLLVGSTEPVRRSRGELVFPSPHYQGDTPHSAIYLGGYKAIKFYETGEVKLFDIGKDIGERNNLASQAPDKAGTLEKRLMKCLSEIGAQLPTLNSQAVKGKIYRGKPGGKRRRGGSIWSGLLRMANPHISLSVYGVAIHNPLRTRIGNPDDFRCRIVKHQGTRRRVRAFHCQIHRTSSFCHSCLPFVLLRAPYLSHVNFADN